MAFKPTSEQQAIFDAAAVGDSLVIQALAGAGKTSSLEQLTHRLSGKGIYLAFNRSIALEAKQRFAKHVTCSTVHGLAFREVGVTFAARLEGGQNGKLSPMRVLQHYRLGALGPLTPLARATLLLHTLDNYMNSDDDELGPKHAPSESLNMLGTAAPLSEGDRLALAQQLAADAQTLWNDSGRQNCPLPVSHSYYLKRYALSRPTLPVDYVLLDEAQDTNPVTAGIVDRQACQRIYVGDTHQTIYTFRGAVNALDKVKGCRTLYLTQSFRFGDNIASLANLILGNLQAAKPIRGFERDRSQMPNNTAVLFRTNMGLFGELITRTIKREQHCHVAGGTSDVVALLTAVGHLQEDREVTHPDLVGFRSWQEYAKAAEQEGAPKDMQQLVKIVSTYPRKALSMALTKAHKTPEDKADIVLSTTHKSKGREWPIVILGQDFFVPSVHLDDIETPFEPEEARLNYVAVTRAQKMLRGGQDMLLAFEGRLKALMRQQDTLLKIPQLATALRRLPPEQQKARLAALTKAERAALADHLAKRA